MESSVGNAIYCCVSKGNKILYLYNGGDSQLETLAALCLENCPPFHAQYFHNVGKRTFGFLVEDGLTYFAIFDSSSGSVGVLRFLEHIRDGFDKASRNGFEEELVHVVGQLMQTLESMSHATDKAAEGGTSDDRASLTMAPLLGKGVNSSKLNKKLKDRMVEAGDVGSDHTDRAVKIDIPEEQVGTMSLQKSSSAKIRAQRLWWRHVKIVVAIDVLVCFVLFGVWLAVCNGFRCVSR